MIIKETPAKEDELHWLNRALAGDADSFMHLIELYQKPVFNLCYRMLGNREDAEDAAQETFLRAYKNLKKYDQERSFVTWLLAISAHYCIDQLRKNRINLLSFEDLSFGELSDSLPSPEKKLTQKDEQQRVQRILQQLSELDRAVIILCYWYEMSYEEIGSVLNLSVSAVKSRLHRARKTMALKWMSQFPRIEEEVERKPYETPVV
ncbi:MAG: RNA polymerase sigma factor [Anaerolineales bacterium]